MEIEFNKNCCGNIYNLEMSEEFIKEYEGYLALEKEQEKEFDNYLKSKGIKL